jgi:uncharacterized membrane protein
MLRAAVIASIVFLIVSLAIILTIYKDRIWKPLSIEAQNVTETNHDEITKGNSGKPLRLATASFA